MKKNSNKFTDMTVVELREATREFNRELPVGPDGLPGRPMNAEEQRQWKAVRRKMGSPKR